MEKHNDSRPNNYSHSYANYEVVKVSGDFSNLVEGITGNKREKMFQQNVSEDNEKEFQPIIIGMIPDMFLARSINFYLDCSMYVNNADDVMYYSLNGRLPAGITFDSKIGIFSGIPEEIGVFNISIGVCGYDGNCSSGTLVLIVEEHE